MSVGEQGTSYFGVFRTTGFGLDSNRLTQIVDSLSGTITRSYDGLDRLTQEVTPQGTVSYTYDAASRRTSMTVLGQPTVAYTYDNADRLTQITQGAATVSFTYDNANRRTSLTLPNGVVTEYAYDAASRLTGLTYKLGTTPLGTLTYGYDANGNRTILGGTWARTGLPAAVASASYNAANHQLTFGSTTLTYDLNGNLTSDGTNTYTWDARNRLVAITGGSAASFQYDGQGRRISKTINSAQTGFLYDGLTPVQELDGSTVVANLLTSLGIDEYLTRTDTSGTSHFLGGALGSTIALTDSIGSVSSSYTYAPFGATGLSGSATGNVFDYTGREDDGTGLKYYRARYYHPGLQRFVSEDPIGFAGGDPNLYAYVFDAPTGYRDPSGLAVDPVSLTALAIFCGGGAVVNVTTKFALAGRKPTLGEAASAAAIGCGLGVLTLTAGIAAGVAGTGVLLAGEVATTGTGTAAGLTGAGTALSGVAATTAGQILSKAEPWGSALKSDAYHRAATYMRAEAATRGAHFRLPGGSTLTQIPGGLNGANGRYDYIVDQAGRLTHQFFVPGGTINGTPIAP